MKRLLPLLALIASFAGISSAQTDAQTGVAGCPVTQHCALLQWNASTTLNATYNVWRLTGPCPSTQPTDTSAFGTAPINTSPIPGTPAPAVTYTDQTVTGGTTYCYVVTAILGSSQSGPSNDAQGAIPGAFPPAQVSIPATQ